MKQLKNGKNGPGGDRTRDPRISLLFYKYDALPTVLRGLVIYNDIFIYSLLFLFLFRISFHFFFVSFETPQQNISLFFIFFRFTNYLPDSSAYRSCHYRNLFEDATWDRSGFVMFPVLIWSDWQG